ncbi:sensor histidine kinase [Membranihabitans maritimus]|uniref:sensor histidine kinase n=1 Tax=Membranihabitans maritimus TaxID=2904244 RepID=UPI001F3D71F3|nr:ATP-binding protein [Membranihabitans maritimus]
MNIKVQFGLFIGLLIIALSVTAFLLLRDNILFLIVGEIIIIIIILLAFLVYSKIFRPLDQLKLGSEALRDRHFTSKLRPTDSPEMNNLITVYNNIIENIREERVYQQEQHYFLQLLVEALPVGILILDYDDNLSTFNPEAKKILKLKAQDIGQSIHSINPILEKELKKIKYNEVINFRTGGNKYYRCIINKFMHRGFSRKFIILEDVSSERIAIEKESYGKVIRMMAHEVNNSVGAINSILDSLLNGSRFSEHELNEYLSIVLERNKNLNRFMRNFADVVRIPSPNMTTFDLNTLVKHVYLLLETQLHNTDIICELLLPESEVLVRLDRDQMEQVFINVILNSIQAIEGKGKITIEVREDPRSVRIQDTGTGITPGNAQKIFTPFFSTKPSGQGVGLTMVREILNNHNLNYSLTSDHNKTAFLIEL